MSTVSAIDKALGALVFGQAVQIAMIDTGRSLSEVRAALSEVYEEKWYGRSVEMKSVLDLAQDIIDHLNHTREQAT